MVVRATMNNARAGKNGVFLAKHLDSENGKAAKMGGLRFTWSCDADQSKPFENVEADFYETHFRKALDAQNERDRKGGHKKRVKTMDDYRTSERYCPESTIYYLGDKNGYVDPRLLLECVAKFLNWREQEYPLAQTLDFALHTEEGAPHIQERHVWIAHDQDGNETVCQEQSLAEMGVKPSGTPPKDGKTNRYYNAKITYTDRCRAKLQEIAREHGIEIIDKPRERGKQGQTRDRYITEKTREEQQELQKDILLKEKVLQEQQKIINGLKNEIDDIGEYKAFRSQKAKAQAEREAREAREKAEREALEKAKREAEEARKRTEQVITVGGGVPPRKTAEEKTHGETSSRLYNQRKPYRISRYTHKCKRLLKAILVRLKRL